MSQFSLPHEIILEGSGFEWIIKFEQVTPEGFTEGHMMLKMWTLHEERGLGCVPFASSYSDLVELFEERVIKLFTPKIERLKSVLTQKS